MRPNVCVFVCLSAFYVTPVNDLTIQFSVNEHFVHTHNHTCTTTACMRGQTSNYARVCALCTCSTDGVRVRPSSLTRSYVRETWSSLSARARIVYGPSTRTGRPLLPPVSPPRSAFIVGTQRDRQRGQTRIEYTHTLTQCAFEKLELDLQQYSSHCA